MVIVAVISVGDGGRVIAIYIGIAAKVREYLGAS
jgi:hypothetical protein